MPTEFRNGSFQLKFAPESSFGTMNTNVYSYGEYFGIHSALKFPDPTHNYKPVYGLSKNSRGGASRSWQFIIPGTQEFAGSFNNIILTSGHILPFILGKESASTKTADSGNQYIQHLIQEDNDIPSFTMDARYFNIDPAYADFIRRWYGCKIDNATIYCEEGEHLKLSINKLVAKNMIHNVSEVADDAEEPNKDYLREQYKYSSSLTDENANEYFYSGERDPYLFSECFLRISDGGQELNSDNNRTLARLLNFSLSIDNNLRSQYYLTNDTGGGDQYLIPYEILPGRREYKLTLTCEIMDWKFYKFLMNRGKYGNEFRGLGISIEFFKRYGIIEVPTNTLKIYIPGVDNEHSWEYNVTDINPISGDLALNQHLGAFPFSADHSVTEDIRPKVNLTMTVPSVSFIVNDSYGRYLDIRG